MGYICKGVCGSISDASLFTLHGEYSIFEVPEVSYPDTHSSAGSGLHLSACS